MQRADMMITNAWLAMRFLIVFFVIYLTAAATVWSAPVISGLSGSVAVTREVQGRLTAWTNTSISFAINQGAFASLGDKYLYVIGADCKASNGFLLTSSPPRSEEHTSELQ